MASMYNASSIPLDTSVYHCSCITAMIYFLSNTIGQAMLFVSFGDDRIESFKSQIHEAARKFSGNNISFLIGDVADADRVFQVIVCTTQHFLVKDS
jgi:FlaA1/EpsC-like NDP-sugar epimerase